MTEEFAAIEQHCVSCGKAIPHSRTRNAITCSDECSAARKRFRRNRQDARQCRYCAKPSTPEQRARFQRWRRWEEKNPPSIEELDAEERVLREQYAVNPPRKRGRPKLEKEAPASEPQEMQDAG